MDLRVRRKRGQFFGYVASAGGDAHPFSRQRVRYGKPDALARTGDGSHLATQIQIHRTLLS